MGSITISIEVELAWGHHDTGNYGNLSDDRIRETKALQKLLDVCKDCDISITFAVVGHLLLDSCNGVHKGTYPSSWFQSDPGTNITDSPHFYAPDLVELIEQTDVNHEICTHTFSHTPYNELGQETVKEDIERALKIHERWFTTKPSSLIPPRNSVPPLKLLNYLNISTVRVPNKAPADSKKGKYSNRIEDWTRYRGHPVSQPEVSHNVVKAYSTRYPSLTAVHLPNGQRQPPPIFQAMPVQWRQMVHYKYLQEGVKKALDQNANAHYWTHLQNLSNSYQLETIEEFLQWVSEVKDNRNLDIKRLKDLQ